MTQTATNPQTGETVVLVGNQWKRAEQTATNEKGETAYLVSGQWVVVPGAKPAPTPAPSPEKSNLEKATDFIKKTGLGVPGGIATTMAAEGLNQVGQAIDRAAYGTGGKVTDIATGMGASPEVAGGLGYATNVAVQAAPVLLGGEVSKVTSPSFRAGAESLMQSAIKPTLKSLKDGSAARAISTMLDEGINVTKGGVAKLKEKIRQLNNEIKEAIKNSPATIDKNKAASELYSTVAKFEKQVDSASDVKAIEGVWTRFLNHPLINGDRIPVQLAQELKQGTYKALEKKYGQLGSAEVEAQKTVARGLKEGIAEAVPGIAGLNARESKLITALQQAERRALMDGNKNPVGLAWLAHNPTVFAAFMADKSALFKSVVARMLNAGKKQIPATTARVGIAGYEAATQNQQ